MIEFSTVISRYIYIKKNIIYYKIFNKSTYFNVETPLTEIFFLLDFSTRPKHCLLKKNVTMSRS